MENKIDTTPIITEERLRLLVANAPDVAQQMIDNYKLPYRIENGELKDALEGTELQLKHFITYDPDMMAMKDDVRKLAKVDDEVLIVGETGTGKEIIARALKGSRTGNFIVANCGGLPEQLIESELFGYVRGAFTGAITERRGMCQMANDGVLFLDEIGELPLHVQAKLLRMLQESCIRKVGGTEEEKVRVKFVFATNKNLPKMVDNGLFREDLFARLSTFEVHIKPIRERIKTDVPAIARSLDGEGWLAALEREGISLTELDYRFNVRSIRRFVKRFKVQGRVSKH